MMKGWNALRFVFTIYKISTKSSLLRIVLHTYSHIHALLSGVLASFVTKLGNISQGSFCLYIAHLK